MKNKFEFHILSNEMRLAWGGGGRTFNAVEEYVPLGPVSLTLLGLVVTTCITCPKIAKICILPTRVFTIFVLNLSIKKTTDYFLLQY